MTVEADGIIESPIRLAWSVAMVTHRGETESGDLHLVRAFADGVLIAAVDGLGHGEEAALAAKTAVATLADNPHDSMINHFKRCHERLVRSRGVVMNVASFGRNGALTWAGVGNIAGVLIREDTTAGPPHEHLLVQGGVVGFQLPPVRLSVLRLNPGDTLIFTTDGIGREFSDRLTLAKNTGMKMRLSGSSEVRLMAGRIIGQHATGTDDALVMVVRYLGD